ncbi:unnamed protein product [Brachionus calyciflorus]|uniref:Reverse transcriptase domain-containing protein n=1 Tax=Brachionus calyciflorus TaxID=104777 RepID=A0A813ZZJ3_9BILA|nr:unnamed protein product [Brachionus calyciflorus]
MLILTKDKNELCNVFNRFFTLLSSSSNSTIDEYKNVIDGRFDQYKIKDTVFILNFTTANELNDLLKSLPSSSNPGICGIPTKIFKISSTKLRTIIAYFFKCSIMSCVIPNDWKTAIVLPLYKNKGSNDDLNNYRAISILPPIAKLFEKLIHKQILIGLLLFIDFRKASEFVKIDDYVSDSMAINLSVPQESVLGPLLFLVFINDIVKYLGDFIFKIFADDTTILKVSNELKSYVISEFSCSIEKLVEWCKFNRIDNNWNKTSSLL